jgi:hypothetical protein
MILVLIGITVWKGLLLLEYDGTYEYEGKLGA